MTHTDWIIARKNEGGVLYLSEDGSWLRDRDRALKSGRHDFMAEVLKRFVGIGKIGKVVELGCENDDLVLDACKECRHLTNRVGRLNDKELCTDCREEKDDA